MASLVKSLNLSHEHAELLKRRSNSSALNSIFTNLFISQTKLFAGYSNSYMDDELIFAPLRLGVAVVESFMFAAKLNRVTRATNGRNHCCPNSLSIPVSLAS